MSNSGATYSFLPWLRQGIANKITGTSGSRASISVKLDISGTRVSGGDHTETISQKIQLFGPGDLIGIDKRAICKVEPQDWITNFEPNYLPYIEFYDEDFPWRYTPAAPNNHQQLLPWLALVVLKEASDTNEAEFKEYPDGRNGSLPVIEVKEAKQKFPNAEQLWAWAHVHVNRDLVDNGESLVSADADKTSARLQQLLKQNPDLACSRIICPRKLEENTAYHAFLIPAFESGRLAGLDKDPNSASTPTESAWAKDEAKLFPYYHRWYFRTGVIGDFEYLVRLLEPKPANPLVGVRNLDVSDPGVNLPGVTKFGGILRLGGALRVPLSSMEEDDQTEAADYENWATPYPRPFQEKLASLVNLAHRYKNNSAKEANKASKLGQAVENDPDPMITPPLYGQWHAFTQRLLKEEASDQEKENWVHELNLDPRHRVAAGLGSQIIQKKQEDYMKAAWEQVGDILELNRTIRAAQLAKEVSTVWHSQHLASIKDSNLDKFLSITAPVQGRIRMGENTVAYDIRTSKVATSTLSMPLRCLARPWGHLSKRLTSESQGLGEDLVSRMNEDEFSKIFELSNGFNLSVTSFLNQLYEFLSVRFPSTSFLPGYAFPPDVLSDFEELFNSSHPDQPVPDRSVDIIRRFQIYEKAFPEPEKVQEQIDSPPPDERDEWEPIIQKRLKNFQKAIKKLPQGNGSTEKVPKKKLNLQAVSDTIFKALNPDVTIPRRIAQRVKSDRIRQQLIGEFQEVMAYPEFDTPMYKPLVDRSTELFLPNINLLAQNSITLLESNPKFIEAYMVGLNHEFSRELLWREYPTDQRGSYFRQFWDVSSFYDSSVGSSDDLREKLKDIRPIHAWSDESKHSKLGEHNNREEAGSLKPEVVLVIRGELLKKYPTAVIYAHRAEWRPGNTDKSKPRRLVPLTQAEAQTPPRDKIRTPLYQAKIEPDIYFLGFDLPVTEARGDGEDEAGWFFVIKERPSEVRFGLDIERDQAQTPMSWNDLSWKDIQMTSGHIDVSSTPTKFSEIQGQLRWGQTTNSAQLAHILYQPPVQIAVHGAELLPLS